MGPQREQWSIPTKLIETRHFKPQLADSEEEKEECEMYEVNDSPIKVPLTLNDVGH